MIRWDLYTIKHAVTIYLDREKEVDTNWETEVLVDIDTNQILEWNVLDDDDNPVPEPTNMQLEEAWQTAKLNHYKTLQISKISSQFKAFSVSGGQGCLTSVLDSQGNPIRVDARRGGEHNDVENFREALGYMDRKGLVTMLLKDYYNQYHEVTRAQIEQVYFDLVDYGFLYITQKWNKQIQVLNASTIEQVTAIDFYSA